MLVSNHNTDCSFSVFTVPGCSVHINQAKREIVFDDGLFTLRCKLNNSAKEPCDLCASFCRLICETRTTSDPELMDSLLRRPHRPLQLMARASLTFHLTHNCGQCAGSVCKSTQTTSVLNHIIRLGRRIMVSSLSRVRTHKPFVGWSLKLNIRSCWVDFFESGTHPGRDFSWEIELGRHNDLIRYEDRNCFLIPWMSIVDTTFLLMPQFCASDYGHF